MRNLFFSVIFAAVGCVSDVNDVADTDALSPATPAEIAPAIENSQRPCHEADDDKSLALRITACVDADGDGARNPNRCGLVFAADVPDGCIPEFIPSEYKNAFDAFELWSQESHGTGLFDWSPWQTPVDCQDRDPTVHPGTKDVPLDGIDQDCDGIDADLILYADFDGDGFPANAAESIDLRTPIVCTNGPWNDQACRTRQKFGYHWIEARDDGRTDCRDSYEFINPDVVEIVNGSDSNCDGVVTCAVDRDGDGRGSVDELITSPGMDCGYAGMSPHNDDCDDSRADVMPGAPELINGYDDNCADGIDERHCEMKIYLVPRPGLELHGWQVDLFVGALNRNGEAIPADISPVVNQQAPMSGYSPDWLWPSTYPTLGSGDLSITDQDTSVMLRVITDGDYISGVVMNGNYWVGVNIIGGGIGFGWAKHLIEPYDTLATVPFTVGSSWLLCSDVDFNLGAWTKADPRLENNSLYYDLSRRH